MNSFVFWGGMHGFALILHRIYNNLSIGFKRQKLFLQPFKKIFNMLVTFHIVILLWVFFRAENFRIAGQYLSRIFAFDSMGRFELPFAMYYFLLIFSMLFLIDYTQNKLKEHDFFYRMPAIFRTIIYTGIVFLIVVNIFGNQVTPFVYFQF